MHISYTLAHQITNKLKNWDQTSYQFYIFYKSIIKKLNDFSTSLILNAEGTCPLK